jgi:hypothetical protein
MPGPSSRPPKGVPRKVWRIANAIRRDDPKTSDAKAYRIAWAQYHHTVNRSGGGKLRRGLSRAVRSVGRKSSTRKRRR